MSDISSSAAKTHLLTGSGEIQRVSGEAVEKARALGQEFLSALGREASARASEAGRKTIMPEDLEEAARKLLPTVPPGHQG